MVVVPASYAGSSSSESISSTEVVISQPPRLESFPIPECNWKLDLRDVFEPFTLPEAIEKECGVCGDQVVEPEAISVPTCAHTYCKGCLHTYSTMKIRERQYPINCPTCVTTGNTGNYFENDIFSQLDLPQRETEILAELQVLLHSRILNCLKCRQTMHVDRQDYVTSTIVTCPLERCRYRWCRECDKGIGLADKEHHCKNKKLDRLVWRKGWRYCPGCHILVQKVSGCNHITCRAPGCRVHFCYKCGDMICDLSVTHSADLSMAITTHYSHCRQYPLISRHTLNRCSIQ
ncbi:hypothetical protein HYPSUDRAFT_62558 [Hypholoma sublateritium FD-334 SS-4]|uniref:RING-type domain-containing protein n=1 Tax=Hypholoma sublateritium (strain FD-334 SS-4) TaxID=945553 RepID=A0A0D2LKE3_HYPSF|nr:hypothetical protein HYPSUDRAFT_62558 [Hypholoma sublateritium FD-334 SS-4]